MRDFRKYRVWVDSKELVKNVYSVVATFPTTEKYGLSSQMTRAAVSIPSNIAEGCSRSSDKDFKRFLEIAQGSAFELETQLIIAFEIKLIEESKFNESLKNLQNIQKYLNALINKVKLTANSQ